MRTRRTTGRSLVRPATPTVPTRRTIKLPTRTASSVVFGGYERQGHTKKFVDELVTKADDLPGKGLLDPFTDVYSPSLNAPTFMWPVAPQYSFKYLCELPLSNNALGLCIDAYVTNIESYGYMLEYVGPEGQQDLPRVKTEKALLDSFLTFVSPENTLREVKEKYRRDRETTGNGFFEVARNQAGQVTLFDHIPSPTMRVTRKDPEPVECQIEALDPGNPGKYMIHNVIRRFRRFVQMTPTLQKVYFKEFGDPRPIDPKTGKVNTSLPIEDQATEVLWLYNYTPGYLYGTPRWIGQLPAILGSRESEMVNLNFFRENAIPAMVVLVSGGALTRESYEKVRDYVNAVRGQRAMNRVMVLEATVDDNMGGLDHSQPAPRIDIKPMISERQQEGLFQDYDQKNIQKVRASFRLPPIFSGRSEDYTRASAYASMQVAESQIFGPERSFFDEIFNRYVLSTYRPRYHRYKSLGPQLVDAKDLASMVKALGDQGALTPNVAIKIARSMFALEIEPVTQAWGDYPYSAIIEFIRAGGIVDGMDEFIKNSKELIEASKPQPPAPIGGNGARPVKPRPVPAKAPTTKKEMDRLVSDVKKEVLSELQDAIERLEDVLAEMPR